MNLTDATIYGLLKVNGYVASDIIFDADNTYDIGAVGAERKDSYVDGTGYIDTLSAFTLSGKLTGGSSEIEGTHFDINGGTVDGITSLTVANNVDIGSYTLTALRFVSDQRPPSTDNR